MDPVIIEEKIESLRRCVRRVQERTPPEIDRLVGDVDIQDIVVLNLTRAIRICVDIGSHIVSETDEAAPATMGSVFAALKRLGAITPDTCEAMTRAVGFRNVAVHAYSAINWEVVFAICHKSLADFRRFANETDHN